VEGGRGDEVREEAHLAVHLRISLRVVEERHRYKINTLDRNDKSSINTFTGIPMHTDYINFGRTTLLYKKNGKATRRREKNHSRIRTRTTNHNKVIVEVQARKHHNEIININY